MPATTTRVPSVSFTSCGHVSPSGDHTPVDNSRVPSTPPHTPAPILLTPPDDHEDEPPPAEPPPAEPPPDFPAGLLWAHILQDTSRPRTPSTPFEFPLDPDDYHTPSAYALGQSILRHADLPAFPPIMDSVTRVVGSPRVFGLKQDSSSYVQVRRTSTSLMDAGANTCLTGDLNLLVDVVEIPPLPISVAVQGASPSLDDCCTKGVIFLSNFPMALHTGNFASTVKIPWKPSSRPRLFSKTATSSTHGHRLGSNMVVPDRFVLIVTMALSP